MRLIGAHVKDDIIEKIDSHIRDGIPGEPGYYSSRSAFLTAAITHLLGLHASELNGSAPKMNPVARQAPPERPY